jgi:hypothetical protein
MNKIHLAFVTAIAPEPAITDRFQQLNRAAAAGIACDPRWKPPNQGPLSAALECFLR